MAKLGRPAVAIVIMAAIIGVLMVLCTPRTASRRSVVDSPVKAASPGSRE